MKRWLHKNRSETKASQRNRQRHSAQRRLALETLDPRLPLAIDISMLADINTTDQGSRLSAIVTSGNHGFFTLENDPYSAAYSPPTLWQTDGTSTGTAQVYSSQDGTPINVYELTDVDGTMFFNGCNYSYDCGLWKSDGTPDGTMIVKEGTKSGAWLYSEGLTNVSGELFFSAYVSDSAWLWKSDGTESGTVPVKEIRVDDGAIGANGLLYFPSNQALWKSDGTVEGTELIRDFGASGISELTDVNGTVFFIAENRLWKTDGTFDGTTLVKNTFNTPISNVVDLTNVAGTLYFQRNGVLWKSDGTNTGTKSVSLNVEVTGEIANFNGKAVFAGRTDVSGVELWQSDGTSAGTTLIADLAYGGADSSPRSLQAVGSTLYFVINQSQGDELWSTDGMENGTHKIEDLGSDLSVGGPVASVNGNVLFPVFDAYYGIELWQSDGTLNGSSLFLNLTTTRNSSGPVNFTVHNDTLFFTADDGLHGVELWKYNAGYYAPELVQDINTKLRPEHGYSTYSSSPNKLHSTSTGLYFATVANYDNYTIAGLWKTDGDYYNTYQIDSCYYGLCNDLILGEINGNVLFSSSEYRNGDRNWLVQSYDGQAVFNLGDAVQVLSYSNGETVNDVLFFACNYYDSLSGATYYGELCRSDGTPAGTTLVQNINTYPDEYGGDYGSYPDDFISAGGLLFFTAQNDFGPRGLWKSSTYSAQQVTSTDVVQVISTGSHVFFVQQYDSGIFQLWGIDASDGIVQDPVQLTSFLYGSVGNLVNADGVLYFTAFDDSGLQLWKSDGTLAGTMRVTNLPGVLAINDICAMDGVVLFTANYDYSQESLYVTDGTELGTKDISNYFFRTYDLQDAVVYHGDLYFAATNQYYGTELTTVKLNRHYDIGVTASEIPAGSGGGVRVGDLVSHDVDYGDTYTYTLVAGAGDANNDSFVINGDQLLTASGFIAGANASYTVRVRSTDQQGLWFEDIIIVTTTGSSSGNSAPTNMTLSKTTLAENAGASATVGTLSTTDPDAGDTFAYTLVSGSGDVDNAAFSISGATLQATSSFNFEAKFSYTVRVRSTDLGGLTTEKSFTISVTNVNESPTNVALSSASLAEAGGADATVGTLSTTDPDAGDTFTYTLVSGTGDADNAAFSISGATLKANSSLDFESKSSYTVRVGTTDLGGLTTEKSFTITVTNVNESPTNIALSSASLSENAGASATVGTLSTTDPDAGDTFTYTLVSGSGDADNAAFSISGATLKATSSLDFEAKSSYMVRVRTTDLGGLSTENTFTISVTNVNESPTNIALSKSSVTENSGANAVVGTLSSTDPDAGDTFTYTLVSGSGSADNAAFNISGATLRVTSNLSLSAKSSYSVRVRSTDQGGLFLEKVFIITVTKANAAPTNIGLSPAAIAENAGVNATVGNLSTTDANAGDSFTYSLVSGAGSADNNLFNISGATLRANSSFDFESKTSYAIRVRTTDQGGLFVEKTFTIRVTNVNEAPNDLSLSANTIPENAGKNAVVGTWSASDPDAGNTFTYRLAAGEGDADNAKFNISGNKLRATSSLDFETQSSYEVRVRVTDQGKLSFEKNYTISLVNLPELVSVTINGADSFNNINQRSQITSLVVVTDIPLPNPETAFSLVNLGLFTASNTPLASSQILVSSEGSTYTLRFGSGAGVVSRNATGSRGNSLDDGNWLLQISASQLSGRNQFGSAAADRFFRMFGDSDGDGDVDGIDNIALRNAQIAANYNSALDFDGDGAVRGGVDTTKFSANYNKKRRSI